MNNLLALAACSGTLRLRLWRIAGVPAECTVGSTSSKKEERTVVMAQTNSKSEELGELQSAVANGNGQLACSSQQQDVRGSRSAWYTKWTSIPSGPIPHIKTRPDYRSRLPPSVQEVAAQFRPVVQDGQWTTGLFECWFHKHRHAGRLESSSVKLCYGILSCPNNSHACPVADHSISKMFLDALARGYVV